MAIPMMMEFPAKIARIAETRGLTNRAIAKSMGISPTTVGRWMSGESKISLEDSARLARVLGVEMNYLADDALDEPQPERYSPDEAVLLRVFRSSGLSVDDAIALFVHRAARRPDESYEGSVPSANPTTGQIPRPAQGRKSPA